MANPTVAKQLSCDIFCLVVDNFGDVGVCWRLARQLASEHGWQIRLWVDDPESLRRIAPSMSASGVEVRHWLVPFPEALPADVVIEAFACEIPASYLEKMAAAPRPPVWINLEYLSAESWVEDCHLGISRHPALPLNKVFFFPGFTAATGGLLRERGLGEGFDPETFWQHLGLPPRQPGELRISMFGYDNPALESLLDQWAEGACPVTCLIPESALAARARRHQVPEHGNLRIHTFDFLSQQKYDRLLWACDCNFVRGEDSFVRAHWARRPFVWHIYPQQADAHLIKLRSYLDRLCDRLPAEAEADVREFWKFWNLGGEVAWASFWRHREAIASRLGEFSADLQSRPDLASSLVSHCLAELGRSRVEA